MSIIPYIEYTYSLLLRFYPARFRSEFADEMQAVFAGLLAQEAQRGNLAALLLLLRELVSAPRVLINVYRLNRYRPRLPAGILDRWRSSLFDPPASLPVLDGRDSWQQAALELSLFLALGGALVLKTYLAPVLPQGNWRAAIGLAGAAAALLPVPMFLIGLGRGLPRWAYPSAGVLTAYIFIAALVSGMLPSLPVLLFAALGLALVAAWIQASHRILPPLILRLGRSFTLDWSRISFGLYGLLPLALILAFDDRNANHSTPYLGAGVLFMLTGALVYIRSRRPVIQMAALLAGIAASIGMAALDRLFLESSLAGSGWMLRLWLNLSVLVIAPLLLELLRRAGQAVRFQ
jgi:hypothetical protein